MEKAAESEDEAEFEASAGASLTFPMCAYKLKRGTAVMLKDRPCKLLTVLKVVTSKHGHAKMRLVGQDIFSDKLETQTPAGSHKVTCPFVTTATYTLLDLDEDESMLTLLNGETGELADMAGLGIWEPLSVKLQVYKTAIETAILLLPAPLLT